MTTKIPLYQKLAIAISARNEADIDTLLNYLDYFLQELDCGWLEPLEKRWMKGGIFNNNRCTVDQDQYKKLIIRSSFYKKDENGNPTVWSLNAQKGSQEIDFVVTVKPSLVCGIELAITGRFGMDRHWLKDFLYENFHYALTQTI